MSAFIARFSFTEYKTEGTKSHKHAGAVKVWPSISREENGVW